MADAETSDLNVMQTSLMSDADNRNEDEESSKGPLFRPRNVMQFHRTASIKSGACLINGLFASLPVQKGHADTEAFFVGISLGV